MINKKALVLLLTLILSVGLIFTGCAPPEEPVDEPKDPEEEPKEPEEPVGEIELGYVMWACAEASTHLAQAVIEDELGYEVTATSLEAGGLYSGLARGDVDAMSCAWLPVTHEEYINEYGDDIVEVATHYEGARIGLVVPEYVEANTIPELNDYVDEFGGEIQGIDGGAGIMMATEDAIPEYDLDFDLIEASDVAMTAALMDAIADEEPIVVTGWTPHWKFAEVDLKFLEDPEGVYGEAEYIGTFTREGLEDDAPDVVEFLENFHVTDEELGEVMGLIADDVDPLDAARQFMDDNPDVVEEWLN